MEPTTRRELLADHLRSAAVLARMEANDGLGTWWEGLADWLTTMAHKIAPLEPGPEVRTRKARGKR